MCISQRASRFSQESDSTRHFQHFCTRNSWSISEKWTRMDPKVGVRKKILDLKKVHKNYVQGNFWVVGV